MEVILTHRAREAQLHPRWNDSRIQTENPAVASRLPHAPIQVVVRADASGTTHIFTAALSSFSSSFRASIGTGVSVVWPSSFHAVAKTAGVVDHVVATPNSMCFCVLAEATARSLPVARMFNRAGKLVSASTASVTASVLELGGEFDQVGFVSLVDALGTSTWPISAYTYISIRTNHTRASCVIRRQMISFFVWFYSSPVVASQLRTGGFVPLPDLLRNVVVSNLRQNALCDGVAVYPPPKIPVVAMLGNEFTVPLWNLFASTYTLEDDTHTIVSAASDWSSALDQFSRFSADALTFPPMIFASMLPAPKMTVSVPSYYVGVGIAYNLPLSQPLVISPSALAAIMAGRVVSWNDSLLVALNPTLASVALPLKWVQPIDFSEMDAVARLALIDLDVALTNYTPKSVQRVLHSGVVDAYVYATPGAVGLIPLVGLVDSKVAQFVNRVGVPVAPTAVALEACARDASVPSDVNGYVPSLSRSQTLGCYALSVQVNTVVRSSYVGRECSRAAFLVKFLNWTFTGGKLFTGPVNAMRIGVLPDSTRLASLAVLRQVLCDGISILADEHGVLIPRGWLIAAQILGAVCVALCVGLGLFLRQNRASPAVRAGSVVFLGAFLFGAGLLGASLVMFGSLDRLSATGRVIAAWLLSNGLTIAFLSILVKAHRVKAIFLNQSLARVYWSDQQLGSLILVAVLVDSCVHLARLLIDTCVLSGLGISSPAVASGAGRLLSCTYKLTLVWSLLIYVPKALWLLYGILLALETRNVPAAFNESSLIATIIYNTSLFSTMALITTYTLSDSNPIAVYIVQVLALAYCSFFAILFLFVPLVHRRNDLAVVSDELPPNKTTPRISRNAVVPPMLVVPVVNPPHRNALAAVSKGSSGLQKLTPSLHSVCSLRARGCLRILGW
jgi:ABC-type phosphate transport system substrate-binding protein